MFWRRGGGMFDYGDNSLIAWIVRIVVAGLIGAAVILMARLWIERQRETVAAFSGADVQTAPLFSVMERD